MKFGYTFDNGLIYHHTFEMNPVQDNFVTHTHEHCELYLFLSGSGSYMIEGVEYKLTPGDILITRAAESHFFKLTDNLPYERIVINFNKSLFDILDPNGLLSVPFENRELGRDNLYNKYSINKSVIDNFIKNMISLEQKRANKIEAKLVININLLQILDEIRKAFFRKDEIATDKADDLIVKIVNYINTNLTEKLTIESLADKFYISKSYLTTKFKLVTGLTVWQYITTKRLYLAKKLIKEGYSVHRAAIDFGFNDYSTFYRRYIELFGVTPKSDKRILQ